MGRTGRLAAHGHAYSFFTRNLARIAPPLVALLQAHGQAADPNLVALAEAWRLAEKHLAATGQKLPGMVDAGGGRGSGCEGVVAAAAVWVVNELWCALLGVQDAWRSGCCLGGD